MAETDNHKRLVRLNEIEVLLGIIVAVIAIAACFGSWYVLPYRVGELEKAVNSIKSDITNVQKDSNQNRELLIRIDERLMAVQRALKIPTDSTIRPTNSP